MAPCGACVLLAVLAARSIADASSAVARGTVAPAPSPRPPADGQQLRPPTSTPPPPTAATSSSSEAGDDVDGRKRKQQQHDEEVDEGQQLDDDPPGLLHTITTQVKLFMTCVPRWGPAACLKLEALLILHGESGESVEGFIEGPDSASRQGSFFAELSERPEARDAYLNKMLLQAVEDLLEDALGLSRDTSERGMRRRRRWPNPLLAVLLGLGSLIIVGGIAKTAMIAGKALALSMLALALAVMMGLRGNGNGGGGGGGFGNYEVLASRRRVGVSSPAAQYTPAVFVESAAASPEQQQQLAQGLGGFGQGQGGLGQGMGQGLGGQSMAYSGHHTRP